MPAYRPNDDEARLAWLLAEIRNSKNASQTNLPGGETATPAERKLQHYAAALAEKSVARLTNLDWSGVGKGARGLIDVGNLLEVRSITDRNKNLLIRRKDVTKDTFPFVLVHVSTQSRVCTLLGWAFVTDILERGWILDRNSQNPAYILNQSNLRTYEALIEFVAGNWRMAIPRKYCWQVGGMYG